MKKFVLVFWLLFLFQNAFCQEFELIRHQVQMGETVRMLSKKYKVEPSEIYRLNKFAIDGIKQGMTLQILVPKKEAAPPAEEPVPDQTAVEPPSEQVGIQENIPPSENPVQEVIHTVEKGETLYSLSKKYKVTVDDIKVWNAEILKKGLQSGQVLTIRANN